MEVLTLLKEIVQKGDCLCKLDLKDVYCQQHLTKLPGIVEGFHGKEIFTNFFVDALSLGPASRIFTKLTKIPIAFIESFNVQLIMYMDDILVMGSSLEKIMMSRDGLIFILQNLELLIYSQKSVLNPSHQIQFLGVETDSLKIIVYLPLQKK